MSNVLILSAKPIFRTKEAEALARDNIQITALSDYSEDFWKTVNGDFDLIIINDDLPSVDINQVCRQIRGSSRAILILLGNKAEWEMREKRKEIGFDRYYKKPIEPRELAIRIKHMQSKSDCARRTEVEVDREIADTEEGQVALPPVADQAKDNGCQACAEPASVQQGTTNIWQNPKIAKLVSSLLSGKISQINPEIDLGLKDGFSYREADTILGTSGNRTAAILESVAKEGFLLKENFAQILLSPSGSVQLIPVEICPNCDSELLTRGKIIEHFTCGHVGVEEDFISGLKYICPKCKKELKLIGTDYRSPGMRYSCHNCNGMFHAPKLKCRCLKTGEIYDLDELRQVWLYSYHLNEAHRQQLEFELEPKKQLIDYLNHLGYDVKESVQLQGRSGAVHTIDLLAHMEDLVAKHTVAIGILAAPNAEEEVTIDSLFGFDSKIYDIGIDHKIVLAIPKLVSEATKFAERQGIRVYSIEELRTLLSRRIDSPVITVDEEKRRPIKSESEMNLAKLSPKGWLKCFLEKKGYHVTEKAKVSGRSGAEHVIELYAQKDDGIIRHKLAACVIKNGHLPKNIINEVVQFDTAAYDAGIPNKVIISVPSLSKAAKQFAQYQRIKVLEAKDLADFSGKRLKPKRGETNTTQE